ncbi:MAG: hypothetical protein HY675_22450 [Chloroflexi bacterium]|nr:hypothetical protein [Chloroflexota bacterium]
MSNARFSAETNSHHPAFQVVQDLPAGTQVVDAGGGTVGQDSIAWNTTVQPGASLELRYTLRSSGAPGSSFELPGARLAMADPSTSSSATFATRATALNVRVPVAATGAPSQRFPAYTATAVTITLSNLRADQATDGTLDVETRDAQGNRIFLANVPFSLDAGASRIVDVPVYVPQVGFYRVTGVVGVQGATLTAYDQVVEAYAQAGVGYKIHFPVILSGQTSGP